MSRSEITICKFLADGKYIKAYMTFIWSALNPISRHSFVSDIYPKYIYYLTALTLPLTAIFISFTSIFSMMTLANSIIVRFFGWIITLALFSIPIIVNLPIVLYLTAYFWYKYKVYSGNAIMYSMSINEDN